MTEEPNGNTEGALTRREARERYQTRTGALARRSPVASPTAPATRAPAAKKNPIKRFANVFVLVAAVGVVGTAAIPAYAFNPSTQGHAGSASASASLATMTRADAQSAAVGSTAQAPAVNHDSYQATSITDINSSREAAAQAAAAAKLAAQRTAAAKVAAAKAASYSAAYSGPTAAQYLAQAAPSGTSYSLSAVLATAKKYIGVPYVYGGSTPAGFDCSGFVMFVYAQFGVSLPHSSSQQAQIGQTVSLADAQPGDVIALNDGSHVGFYAGRDASGNVLILDAPKPGGHVSIRELWTTAYHIQHFGG
ncbi:C40 family peptidase [Gryllotalpicola reticulitermitis]|uniref:C40 family peptidase n=1 Tax=Gryllotalpicola reticulitermitis TaxID=1184153 RepID=A0ABV8Q1V6_9MICO